MTILKGVGKYRKKLLVSEVALHNKRNTLKSQRVERKISDGIPKPRYSSQLGRVWYSSNYDMAMKIERGYL